MTGMVRTVQVLPIPARREECLSAQSQTWLAGERIGVDAVCFGQAHVGHSSLGEVGVIVGARQSVSGT